VNGYYFFSNRIEEGTLHALITANGGEIIPFDELERKGLMKSGTPPRKDDDKGAAEKGEKGKEEDALGPRERQSVNNLKQIMLAVHSVHDVYKFLPPAAICDKQTGKPLLSWRVAILPYVEQGALYKQFKLDEPWDSPHNKKLLEPMPAVYEAPGVKTQEPHLTFYRVFITPPGNKLLTAWTTTPDKKSPFGARGMKLSVLVNLDGASNTIGVVEAGEAVPWTKPDPLVYDAKKPLPKLGGLFKDGFYASMLDGSVRFFSNRLDEHWLRAYIVANDGISVPEEKLLKDGLMKLSK
jgi:hypothetical protein